MALDTQGRPPDTRDAKLRVKSWVRSRFGLRPEDVVAVAEHSCSVPGCPPNKTVVIFSTNIEGRHTFSIFKPLQEIAESDLPPAWLRPELRTGTGEDCHCC